ncbi:MAG: RdgB/HAM1 family non-canonical purine NTP pyrophosphatase [Chitinispirillaceae bacterium]|nr:RdgB/HAM1 family non-canonical purine NTP pyrophosphatase [Chitinispirillaceae bacterium]
MDQQLIIATGNAGKVREIGEIFSEMSLRLLPMSAVLDPVPEIVEDGATFSENARIKAGVIFRATGIWTLGDDSGLAVDALGGAPGIHSARYAGEQADMEANKRKLLEDLADTPESERTARFICTIAVYINPTTVLETEGACEGKIIDHPRGDSGFGYDPLFVPEGYTRTFAQLTASEKHRISHRGRALRKMKELLHEYIRR